VNLLIKLILLGFLVVLSAPSRADWTSKTFSTDSKNHYYVGISGKHESESKAMNEAYQNAIIEAIKHNFGMTGEFTQSSLSALKDLSFQESTNLKGRKVNLEEIEPFKEKIITRNDKFVAYRMIKYPKSAIQKEKLRIKFKIKSLVNTYGEKKSRGRITLKTTPESTLAILTGIETNFKMQGTTNANFYLPLGKYTLTLYKEGFDPETQNVLVTGRNTVFSKILTPSYGFLDLDITPKNSNVYLNNRKVNNLLNIKLLASKQYKLRIEHPDYYSKSENLEVWINQKISLTRELNPKSSKITILSRPNGADVYIDGYKKGTTPLKDFVVTPSNYQIELKKSGHESSEINLRVPANRNMPANIITLKKEIFKPEPVEEEEEEYVAPSVPWGPYYSNDKSVGLNYDPIVVGDNEGAFIPVAFGLQIYFWSAFSVGIDYRRDETTTPKDYEEEYPSSYYSYENYTDEMTITSHTSVNVKFYLIRRESFQLGIGLESHNLDIEIGPQDDITRDIAYGESTKTKKSGSGYIINMQIRLGSTRGGTSVNLVANYRNYNLGTNNLNHTSLGVSFDF
jgi:hypothetical protein